MAGIPGGEEMKCGICGLPIAENEHGLRYFGYFVAHSEHSCIDLLRARAEKAETEVERLKKSIFEIRKEVSRINVCTVFGEEQRLKCLDALDILIKQALAGGEGKG
jgi:hypothetical protein